MGKHHHGKHGKPYKYSDDHTKMSKERQNKILKNMMNPLGGEKGLANKAWLDDYFSRHENYPVKLFNEFVSYHKEQLMTLLHMVMKAIFHLAQALMTLPYEFLSAEPATPEYFAPPEGYAQYSMLPLGFMTNSLFG